MGTLRLVLVAWRLLLKTGATGCVWICGMAVVRMSGTEPLVRIYAEASSVELRDSVLEDYRAHLGV